MGTFIINTEPQQFARKLSPEVEKKLPAIVQKGYCVAESKKKVSIAFALGKTAEVHPAGKQNGLKGSEHTKGGRSGWAGG